MAYKKGGGGGGGVTDGDKGDVVVSSSGSVWTLDSAITSSISGKKTDSMSTNRLLGRGTAGTGAIEEITLGTNLSLSGTTLNASGGGGSFTATTLTVPFSNSQFATLTVTDAAITSSSKVNIFWGNVVDADENSPEFSNLQFIAIPSTGSMAVTISTTEPYDRLGGVYKINYMLG